MTLAAIEFELGELFMQLRDRSKLLSVLIVQEVSQRDLAKAAGYRSHAYIGKLLRGEKDTLSADAALRIAHYLGLPVDSLFLTRVSGINGRSNRVKRMPAA